MKTNEAVKAYAEFLAEYRHDPLGFVLAAFPWGREGTILAEEEGPDVWQRMELMRIGEHLKREVAAGTYSPYRGATSSGHGIGKSAETSWVVLWSCLTCPNTKGVVTANSDTQLRTKTWAEVAKWWDLHLSIFGVADYLFECTATTFRSKQNPIYWAINAIPNNPNNPAGFQGLHNAGSRVLMLFDEASGIEPPIWEAAEGTMTDADTELIFLVYGNPNYPTGRFYDVVVGKLSKGWVTNQIDSRNAKRTNKAELARWAEAWGEDSDFFRVRVRGLFPQTGSNNLFSTADIRKARLRETYYEATAPLVAGLDCARWGDDDSVLRFRRGRDARSLPSKRWKGADTQTLAAEANRACLENHVHTLFVDAGGLGAGVYDRLVVLAAGAYNVIPIEFGSGGGLVVRNGVEARVKNKRAAMYVELAEWMKLGAIDDSSALEEELLLIEYKFVGDSGDLMLEPKAAIKKRLGRSPDDVDALALTFGAPVANTRTPLGRGPAGSPMHEAQNVQSGDAGFDSLMRQAWT